MVWIVTGAFLVALTVGHVKLSAAFAPGQSALGMPILPYVASFLATGGLPLLLFWLIPRAPKSLMHASFWLVFGVGFVARLILLVGTPVLEVDFNRYLWDGGLTFNGYNPYAVAPAGMARLPYDDPRLDLSKAAGGVFDGISYPELKTIYPPVAQAFFALAHGISAWSLTAWRLVAIAAEIVTFSLIVALLHTVGRSPLWVALYWWNPLVLKETIDSAHMEVVLIPFVLGAVLATVRQRHTLSVCLLGLAIGTKLWPILLVPLILRPLAMRPLALFGACIGLAAMMAAFAVPILLGGLGPTSGFVSFANHWATNSAHFPILEATMRRLTGCHDLVDPTAGQMVRVSLAVGVAAIALRLAWPPLRDAQDSLARAYWTVTALLLASPTQFPWYLLWVLPFAILQKNAIAWFVAAALLPIYYAAFHFNVRGQGAIYGQYVVWLIWLPVWAAMARDIRHAHWHNAKSQPAQRDPDLVA